MEVGLIILGACVLVGGIIYLAYMAEKKRTEAMQVACQAMGFATRSRPGT